MLSSVLPLPNEYKRSCLYNMSHIYNDSVTSWTFGLHSLTLGEHGVGEQQYVYRLDLATRSSSSFFLMACELDEPLEALINSSARHSEMDLMLRNEASRAPWVSRTIAYRR